MPAWLEMWCHSGGNGLSTPRSLVTTAYPEGYLVSNRTDGFAGRIQPVDATDSLNISAGVWKPSVLRGLSFNCLAIALS